jgi:electron transfer flavoprotein alpha subunit
MVNWHVLVLGDGNNLSILGAYGAKKVLQLKSDVFQQFDGQREAKIINEVFSGAYDLLVFAHTSTSKTIAGRVAVKTKSGLVTAVSSFPDTSSGFVVKRKVFSGKAIASYNVNSEKKIITLAANSFQPENVNESAVIESIDIAVPDAATNVISRDTVSGAVPLPEAELVVSAGRGLKGPENWGIIEDLADTLGATTACSRPVADSDWRPHHEHVGQTGVAISPNLYIAIGISGAIQHLAGVNNSKVIVVVNKDAEAPFFKAADYGVLGDLFEVVPKLTEAIKKFKAS